MQFLENQACPQRSPSASEVSQKAESSGSNSSEHFALVSSRSALVTVNGRILGDVETWSTLQYRGHQIGDPEVKVPMLCYLFPQPGHPRKALLFNLYLYSPSLLPVLSHEAVDNGNKCGCTQGWGCDRLNKEWTDLLLWGWKLRLSWNKNIIFRVMIYGLDSCLIAGHKYWQTVLTASLEDIRNVLKFILYSNYWFSISLGIIWETLFSPK